MKHIILRALTFPTDITGWLIVLVVRLLMGKSLVCRGGCLVVYLNEKRWLVRRFYSRWGATTFGHAIMVNPTVADMPSLFHHEHVHVRQYEGFAIVGLALAIPQAVLGCYITAAVTVFLIGILNMLVAMTVSWLRGGMFYRNSVMEEAAYDATQLRGPRF